MNRHLIKIVCLVHFSICNTAYALFPIPDALQEIAKTVGTYIWPTAHSASDTLDTQKFVNVNYPLLITHIHLLQELKNKFNTVQQTVILNNRISQQSATEKKLTQTEAYLQRYNSEINAAFSYDLNEHKALIDTIIEREKELSETHYFFYHAHKKELIILHDFIKLLQSYMHLLAPRLDFTCMRFKKTLTPRYCTVNEYLNDNSDIKDYTSEAMSQMLSVNLALFGNHTDFGECTFRYFLKNRSIDGTSLYEHLSSIFSHYEFNRKYLKELTELSSYLTSSTGNLLQICIPHDMVDNLVYLSRPYGKPYKKIILNDHYDGAKKRHTALQPLLAYMCTSPKKIDNLDEWQARLMFFDPLIDMHTSIKVFRYNTVTPKNMGIYQQKLKQIVIQLILDYLATIDIPRNEPLYRLYSYITAHKSCINRDQNSNYLSS